MKSNINILLIKTDNCQPERSGDLRSSFFIIHCQFRKRSAFPAQTPYHYAYNSPLTYRSPSGLEPEKEKEELKCYQNKLLKVTKRLIKRILS